MQITITKHHLGWVFGLGLLGFLVVTGFQAASEKTGVVDLQRAIEQSDLGKQNSEAFQTAANARRGVLDFINTYMVLTTEQAMRFGTLSLKQPLTEQEKTELERIKQDVISSANKFEELNRKSQPTDEERRLLQDYNGRRRAMSEHLNKIAEQFTTEIQQLENQYVTAAIARAKTALGAVSKGQGYSVVFDSKVAPYGANDITDNVVKEMNKKGAN